MKKLLKFCSVLLAACICISIAPVHAKAGAGLSFKAKVTGTERSIKVKKITYEGEISKRFIEGAKGVLSELEVDFLTDVLWDYSAKITSVKDNKGKTYRGYLMDKDDDGCDIVISNMKHGRTYTIAINGVKQKFANNFGKLTLKVKIPKQKAASKNIRVSKVSVDDSYGEVEVEFASKVVWKYNSKIVSVKDNKGKSYKGYLTDKDDDECEIYIENMKSGRTYKIKISGVKVRGTSSFKTVTITAKAPAHRHNLTIKKVEYDEDYDDGRMEYTVSFDFNKDISYTNESYVIIRGLDGKAYSSETSYVEWDDDECEVHLSEGLAIGQKYTYEIVNVKSVQADKYETVKGSFTAYYD